jgi:hypothetical protein
VVTSSISETPQLDAEGRACGWQAGDASEPSAILFVKGCSGSNPVLPDLLLNRRAHVMGDVRRPADRFGVLSLDFKGGGERVLASTTIRSAFLSASAPQ